MFDISKSLGDFPLLSEFVSETCCIHMGQDKLYLFQARLGSLIAETRAQSVREFISMARADATGRLRDKIIDAMTTHETYWFRDARPWTAMEEEVLPGLAAKVASGEKARIRILCAACSTGQEPYSIALLLNKLSQENRLRGLSPSAFEILAFDVSPGSLFIASAGRYSQLEIARGLPDYWRENFFDKTPGNTWTLRDPVRRLVSFKRHNLQDSFAQFGMFDLVLCRNVAIYFRDDFKKDLFTRIAHAILPGGHLLLGGAETLFTHQDLLQIERIREAIFFRRLPQPAN
ncbi:MAG: CheR family methyltransferase [Verrucomicrobiota bacterium]